MLSVVHTNSQTDRQTNEHANSQMDGQTDQAGSLGNCGLLTLYSDVVVDAVGVNHPGAGDDGVGAGVKGESVGNTLAHLVLGPML